MKGSTKKPAMVAFACAGLCACLLVMLTGCASQPEPFVARKAVFTIELVDQPGTDWPVGAVGITRGSGTGVSRIEILADRYDECIKHEIDHVVRGKWHADRRATCR